MLGSLDLELEAVVRDVSELPPPHAVPMTVKPSATSVIDANLNRFNGSPGVSDACGLPDLDGLALAGRDEAELLVRRDIGEEPIERVVAVGGIVVERRRAA